MRLRHGERGGNGLSGELRGIEDPLPAIMLGRRLDLVLSDGRGDGAMLLNLDKGRQPAKGDDGDKRPHGAL